MLLKRISAAAMLAAFAVVPATAGKIVDKTLAVVNGEAIMESEYTKMTAPVLEQYQAMPATEQSPDRLKELKQKLLDQMVDDRLLKQEAKKKKVRATKRDVDQGIAQVKKRFETETDFQAELKKEGISEAQFTKRIEEQIMVMKLIEQEIKGKAQPPTDDAMQAFYAQIQQKMAGKDLGLDKKDEEEIAGIAKLLARAGSEQVHARHILIALDKTADMKAKSEALAKIKRIQKEFKGGATFEALAKKYSDDSQSKARGGDLGFFAKGDMVPEFEKAVFALNVGQVSEPVLTDFGYHLIRLEGRRAGREVGYEDVKNDLKEFLFQKDAQKRYEAWLKDLRAKASIKVNALE